MAKRRYYNPYQLVKGKKEKDYRDYDAPPRYRGDYDRIRQLSIPDIETAHQIAKLVGLDTYAILDEENDEFDNAVFKTRDILDWEAQRSIERDVSRQQSLALVEKLKKTPKHFVIRRYGKTVIYAERQDPDYRPGHFSGVRIYPTLYIAQPKRKRQTFYIENYVKDNRVNKVAFYKDFGHWFGGYYPWGRSDNRTKYLPEPLPTIANDLPNIMSDFRKIKSAQWFGGRNPRFR